MVCEDCVKLKEKVYKMFEFFHDVILDIAEDESKVWFDSFTKEFEDIWEA